VLPALTRNWLYEPKLDGYRGHRLRAGHERAPASRRGSSDGRIPEPPQTCAPRHRRWLLAREIVGCSMPADAPHSTRCHNRVQLRLQRHRKGTATKLRPFWFGFDLLHFCGVIYARRPLFDRRSLSSQCLLPSTHIQLIPVARNPTPLAARYRHGFEGIVAKLRTPIQPGKRSNAWLKIKKLLKQRNSWWAVTRRQRPAQAILWSPAARVLERRQAVITRARFGSGFDR